ncbi:MAG: 3-dehydroquinate synthase, partial [Selenomonas sp.]|nr:3-dehydroquinate synthase [Selenomonas sp.]
MRKVRVDLGEKSYDIIIGYAIDRELVDFVKGAGYSRKALLVTDNNVGPLYAKQVQQLLAEAGLEAAV